MARFLKKWLKPWKCDVFMIAYNTHLFRKKALRAYHNLFEAVSLQEVQNKPVWFACGPRAKRKFNEYARELITLNALCCTLFHSLSCHFYSCLLEKKELPFSAEHNYYYTLYEKPLNTFVINYCKNNISLTDFTTNQS